MSRHGLAKVAVAALLLGGAAWYLHDPPWVAGLTSGIRGWETDPAGTRFRWTAGRASFYVPSDATVMRLPIRALLPSLDGRPVTVRISADDRLLTVVKLVDPGEWVALVLPLPREPARRHYRRLDLRVSRTVGEFNLGVQLGEIQLQP